MGTLKPHKPSWWKSEHTGGWERVKEALRRDWQQTKRDLHLGGHELNQNVTDTVKQMQGGAIPSIDQPNPPKVIGDANDWQRAEEPVGFGYAARMQYGTEHPVWTTELEGHLRTDWESTRASSIAEWDDVQPMVRHGYEFQERNTLPNIEPQTDLPARPHR